MRTLSTLEHLDVYERLVWFLVEITFTFNECDYFDESANCQAARDAIIAALEQFQEPEAVLTAKSKTSSSSVISLPHDTVNEATLNWLMETSNVLILCD